MGRFSCEILFEANLAPVKIAKFVEDLGADSLDTVELVMAFEEEFGIEVPEEETDKLVSVGAVVSYIEGLKGE